MKQKTTGKCVDDVVLDLNVYKQSGDTLWQVELTS